MKEFTAPEKAKVAVLTGKKIEIKELKVPQISIFFKIL